jgi:hypothetical protein
MKLDYPYPYTAWFTIANDPDNTLEKDWEELHQFIWEELQLPISNSLFVKSYNQNLPNQVNLSDQPYIAERQQHDIIHTWGDYMHSRSKGFDRKDAEEAVEILNKHNVHPKVWIDHAQFLGNLLHNNSLGATPFKKDQSGHRYKVFEYSLDLIHKIGIRYVWDGEISSVIGQDRIPYSKEYFKKTSSSSLKAAVKHTLHKLKRKFNSSYKRNTSSFDNSQYKLHEFPDGRKFYTFPRYGTWKDADIAGLGNILSEEKMNALVQMGGTCIAYTHLGKRPFENIIKKQHIPEKTRTALKHVSQLYHDKMLMISPLGELLDYLVIRDHIEISHSENKIIFYSDNIRFVRLNEQVLKGKKFSFYKKSFDLNSLRVEFDNNLLNFELIEENDSIFSIVF